MLKAYSLIFLIDPNYTAIWPILKTEIPNDYSQVIRTEEMISSFKIQKMTVKNPTKG